MQQHPHGTSPRSSPTQSRARRLPLRSSEGLDAVVHDHRSAAAPDAAHTRAPVLIREPTLLESLSRNLRTFLPSSISPPAPRRRPLSTGSPPPMEPPAPEGERIAWAGWDELDGARVLLLAYPTGLQVWDTSDLSAVREVLNVRNDALCTAGPVLEAAVVPGAASPTLAVLTPTHLTLYGLTTRSVVNQVAFNSPCALAARPAFIVVATSHPPTLHILSSSTLASIHTLSLPSTPVFAVSHRLVAYATTAPASGSPKPSFLATSPSPVRALWNAVEDRAWSAATAGVHFSRSAPAASGHWPASPTHSPPSNPAPWIAVLDLGVTPPRQIAHFAPFSTDHASIAHLAFSNTKGAGPPLLCAAPHGGHGVSVFELRGKAMPWHRYALRRGVTRAHVERVVCAESGRWIAVVTARRTVHVFATNREGGSPDLRAHLKGRSVNHQEPRPLSTDLSPLVRLHLSLDPDFAVDTDPSTDLSAVDDAVAPAPLALTFPPPSVTNNLSHALRPTASRGAQDILLFDPARGVLELRRLLLDADADGELAARDGIVATWSLQRARSWPEVFGVLPSSTAPAPVTTQKKKGMHNYLSRAELSTSATMPPLYLVHQFSFHALGEDYASLLAQATLARVPSESLAVRRAIEVRGGQGEGDAPGEEFVQDRTGFDEPLASAIGARLDYHPEQSPPVLPMLPNGQRGSVLGALPIRAAEGLGRIRREIGKVRSPPRRKSPSARASGVPLAFEFDEADEALFAENEREVEEDWDDGAGRAVEEAERFDEIIAARFVHDEIGREEVAVEAEAEAEAEAAAEAETELAGVGVGVRAGVDAETSSSGSPREKSVTKGRGKRRR